MTVKLDFGYMDLEDVVKEDLKCRRFTPHLESRFEERETGRVFVYLTSPFKHELVKYVRAYLGDFSEMAESIVDENTVRN